MKLDTLSTSLGKGLIAGFVGTVAMTASSTIEAKVRGREPSSAPAEAAAKVLGIKVFTDDGAKERFSTLVHWAYGTGWGAARGLMGAAGLSSKVTTPAHFLSIWGGAAVMLPTLDVAPPITMWGKEEIAIDAWHHLVYAVATGLAYEVLDRRS